MERGVLGDGGGRKRSSEGSDGGAQGLASADVNVASIGGDAGWSAGEARRGGEYALVAVLQAG